GGGAAAMVKDQAKSEARELPATADLALATTYTARVKGGASAVKDLAGNSLASDFAWSFTIAAAPPPPSIAINDVSVSEGNAGTVNAVFNVTLSASSSQTVTVTSA